MTDTAGYDDLLEFFQVMIGSFLALPSNIAARYMTATFEPYPTRGGKVREG